MADETHPLMQEKTPNSFGGQETRGFKKEQQRADEVHFEREHL